MRALRGGIKTAFLYRQTTPICIQLRFPSPPPQYPYSLLVLDVIAEWVGVMLNKAKAKPTDRAKWQNSATYSGVETILKSALAVEFNWIKNLVAFTNGTALNTDTGLIERIHAVYHINPLPA